MIKVSSCVTFFGNCRKAIDFYTQIFELNEVKALTFSDKSELFNFDLSPECKDLIYRAELNIKSSDSIFSIVMSDSPVLIFDSDIKNNPNNRDNITFEISSKDREWIEKTYNKLLEEGKRNTPLQEKKGEYDLSGSVMDKFGICWILNCYS
ncbi:MAG: hypothetical protein WBL93_11050 [Lutisporaceae bacterium]